LSSITPDSSLISYCNFSLIGSFDNRSHVGSIRDVSSYERRKNSLSK
jgi:hypothetical protein